MRATDLTKEWDALSRTLSPPLSFSPCQQKTLEWGRPPFEGVTDHFQSFMQLGLKHVFVILSHKRDSITSV